MVKRILVAATGSGEATPELVWAAELAERVSAELLAVRVVAPEHVAGSGDQPDPSQMELARTVESLAGGRGRARTVFSSDPSDAIVRIAEEEAVDLVVVGGSGMNRRGEFLLASLPNRVSHRASCSVVIVNDGASAGLKAGRRSRGRTAAAGAPAEAEEGALLGRVGEIGRVMAKHGVKQLFAREPAGLPRRQAQARHFRLALEELGPTFAKLGQILSTRSDLLPPEFVAELSGLQDRVAPLPEAEVVSLMERELSVPWEDVFESIEPEPMAAGSIAQVHRAVLAAGARVVVKVQRPNAEGLILRDLRLLDAFIQKAAQRPAFRQVVDLPAILSHLSRSLRRELDFREEAGNIERLKEVLAPFARLQVPLVYRDLSTARLLVMEEIEGGPVADAPAGEARLEAARQLLESFYQQVLVAGFFHADPHPGNLMWWKESVYFLDCGMVGELTAEVREQMLLLLLAFWREDPEFLAEVLLVASGSPARDLDRSAFTADLAQLIGHFRELSLKDLRLGPLLEQVTRISLQHGVRMPADMALVGKAFGQVQQTVALLDPGLDPFSVAAGFLLRRTLDRARRWISPESLFYSTEKVRFRAERFVEGLEALVGARPGRNLQVDFYGTQAMEASIRGAAGRLTIGLAAGFTLLGVAVAGSLGHPPAWLLGALTLAGGLPLAALAYDLVRRER